MQPSGRRLAKAVRGNWLPLLLVGAAVIAYLALRTPASPIGSAAEVDAILLSGRPVLLEFFSNT